MSHPTPRVIRKKRQIRKKINVLGRLICRTLFDPPGSNIMVDFFGAAKIFLFFRPEE